MKDLSNSVHSPTVTLVITSCGRLDLLSQTVDSFEKYNTYQLSGRIIIDDSADPKVRAKIEEKFSNTFDLYFNNPSLGQIGSIDRAYSKVSSEYIFHCEDDWLFSRPNFIEESLTILEANSKILQVWLRGDLFHEFDRFEPEPNTSGDVSFYNIISKRSDKNPNWSPGFSFNPGLRRVKDYALIGSYKSVGHEHEIQNIYQDAGMYSVILKEPVVDHIGWDRTVTDRSTRMPRTKAILCLLFPQLRCKSLRKIFRRS
jgi:hypothetical protein